MPWGWMRSSKKLREYVEENKKRNKDSAEEAEGMSSDLGETVSCKTKLRERAGEG